MNDSITKSFERLIDVDMDVFRRLCEDAIRDNPPGLTSTLTEATQFSLTVAKYNYLRLIESGFIVSNEEDNG